MNFELQDMHKWKEIKMETKLGQQQICPKCKMYNRSGLILPDTCEWCRGTGKVDLNIKLTEKRIEFITNTALRGE